MNRNLITLLSVFIITMSSSFSEDLFNVSTANLYNYNNNSIVTFDYDQNYVPELFRYDILSGTKNLVPLYGSDVPYFLLSGFNGKEIVYVNFNPTNKYFIDYYNTETTESKRIVTDGAYKEFIWCSGDKVVWIDYRNAGGNSSNSEVYMYNLSTSTETRITNDTYYQAKAITDGKYIVWVEYRNDLYGNIVLYNIETGQSKFIDQVNYHQDNPKIHGNYIVWEDYLNAYADSENVDVYYYDIVNNTVGELSTELGFQGNPFIYQNIVVWEDYKKGSSNTDINSYNFDTKEYLSIASEQYFESAPQNDQNVVIYVKIENDIISFVKEEKYFKGVFEQHPENLDQCEGSSAIFTVKTIEIIKNKNKNVHWFLGAKEIIKSPKYPIMNDTKLVIDNIDISDVGEYHLEITLTDDNILRSSDVATLNLREAPQIISEPADTIKVKLDDPVTLEIIVSGYEPFDYQWFKDDILLSGYSTELIYIESSTIEDVGNYTCRIINECDTLFSKTYYLQLIDEGQSPEITTQPNEFYSINKGDDLTIIIEAIGTPELKYEWYKNNTLMPDDITNIYSRSNIDVEDGTSYFCIVRNAYGSVISDTAKVEIITNINSQDMLDDFVLYQNEPNPFSDVTNISFLLPISSFVKIAVHDVLGNEKVIIANRLFVSGKNEVRFNSTEFELIPGVYFYSISTKDFYYTRKMVILD